MSTQLTKLLRTDQPLSTGATAVYPYSKKLERQYRFKSRFDDEVLLHELDGLGNIHLPRALCPLGKVDERDDGEDVIFAKCPEPRDHQVKLFDETTEFLKNGQSGVVVAYTGWGKTVLGYKAAHVLQKKTLVVTTKDDIYQQWLKGAEKFLGLKPHQIGEIRQDKCEVVGTSFVVAMIHSLSKEGKYPDWITKGFGLVIFDECHRLPADSFSKVAAMFPAKVRLALSATPNRQDGKELLLYAHVGPIRAQTEAQLMIPKVLRFHTNWQCPRVIRKDKKTGEKKVVRIAHSPGKTAHIEKMMAADPLRNQLIGELIMQARGKDRQIVVFSSLHEHLRTIARVLNTMGVSNKDIGYYIGAQTKAEQEARAKATTKPILLTTPQMMGEGTDLPWYDTCLLAIPRSSIEQIIGRIRREYPDKKEPVVMDLLDNDSPLFSGYASQRRSTYRKIGATVKDY